MTGNVKEFTDKIKDLRTLWELRKGLANSLDILSNETHQNTNNQHSTHLARVHIGNHNFKLYLHRTFNVKDPWTRQWGTESVHSILIMYTCINILSIYGMSLYVRGER